MAQDVLTILVQVFSLSIQHEEKNMRFAHRLKRGFAMAVSGAVAVAGLFLFTMTTEPATTAEQNVMRGGGGCWSCDPD